MISEVVSSNITIRIPFTAHLLQPLFCYIGKTYNYVHAHDTVLPCVLVLYVYHNIILVAFFTYILYI